MEKGNARRSSLKGRERAIVNRTNFGTVSKATFTGETSERRGGAYTYGLFRAHRYHLELHLFSYSARHMGSQPTDDLRPFLESGFYHARSFLWLPIIIH